MFERKIYNKIIIILLIICLFVASANQCIAQSTTTSDQLCYGFIIPSVKYENITIQDQTNCKIRHMINDLLRGQLSVYWMTTNITISVREINNDDELELFFEKGTFIIPFTGDDIQDTKITTIIFDYNQSSEIEDDNELTIPVYILIEQINIQVYPLSEVKIAQHKNKVSTGEICFLEISRECGFLSYELLIDNIISDKLNNDDFNVLTHAGGVPEYATFYKTGAFYTLYSDLRYRVSTAVRKFVSNGGGYIGACYGANMAGSGHQVGPMTVHFKRSAYNPKLPSIVFYCLADYVGVNAPGELGYIQVKIVNDSHPVSFNLDEITWDLHIGGSGFDRIGENVEVIANFHNTNTYMDDTPSWVSSNFGNGKVVAFSPHPEINAFFKTNMSYIGKTTISNALFYTTAKEVITLQLTHSRLFTFIEEILDKTVDIPIDIKPMDIFDEIKDSINEATVELTDLNGYVQQLRDLIKEIANEKNIDLNEKKTFLGAKSLWVTQKYYFPLFVGYLENTTEILTTLENIYPFLENDPDFIQQVETLKSDLSSRLDEIKKICSECYEMCEDYEEALLKYQKRPNLLSRLKEFLITDKGHKLYWHIYSEFIHVPHVYFDSLKFLRNHWYNFETSIALE